MSSIAVKRLFVLSLFIPLLLFNVNTANDRTSDSLALVALYDNTNGPSWTFQWDFSQSINTWQGVVVSSNRVTSLNLQQKNLDGVIPPEIGDLDQLTYLDLRKNLLASVPPEIGNLVNLTKLVFFASGLSGGIPPEIGNLINLQELHINANQLSGSIPIEIGNCSSLRQLHLDRNSLSGAIPSNIGNLSLLTNLHLFGNNLTGSIPASIGNLSNLDYLLLYNNQLSGTIPTTIGGLTSISRLYLYNNQLTGAIPSEIGNIASLENLLLYGNQLTGSIPIQIADCSNLKELALSENALTGSIPSEIANLTQLSVLWLNDNQLTGSIPSEIGNLLNLTELYLHNNQLSGSIPLELGNCVALIELLLYQNQLSGSIPVELGNLANLQRFHLTENQLSGTIPSELGNLINLTEFVAHTNLLSGNISTTLGNLSNCNFLDLSNNQLSGPFPSELGNLSSLARLKLNNNQLNGNVPSQIGNLNNLTELYLHNNQITGLGEGLVNLTNLSALDISNNEICTISDPLRTWADTHDPGWDVSQTCDPRSRDSLALVALYNNTDGPNWTLQWDFSQPMTTWWGIHVVNGRVVQINIPDQNLNGIIPPEIEWLDQLVTLDLDKGNFATLPDYVGNLPNLSKLSLTQCNISGTIPASLGNLSNLTELLLFTNNFTGALPLELANLNNLLYLNLSATSISGTIPPEFGNFQSLQTLSIAGTQLSGSIPAELGNISTLKELRLHLNQLSGEIPVTLGNLSNLKSLSLDRNQLTGTIPIEIGNIDSLTYLYLFNNQLTGQLPSELGNLSNLQVLDLNDNQFSGTIPSELGNLIKLTNLRIDRNQLGGSIPSEIGNLTNLTYLNLYANQLSGTVPSELGNISSLATLHLYYNELTDIGEGLTNLQSLTSLKLEANKFCNLLPTVKTWADANNPGWEASQDCDYLRNRDSLALVAIYNTCNGPNWTIQWDFTQPFGTWAGVHESNDRAIRLILQDVNLTGTFPPELAWLDALITLKLDRNNIDVFPPEIESLVNVSELSMTHCNIPGSIPSFLGNLTNLTELYLHTNNFTGTLPPELALLSNLTTLNLSVNQLSGSIPTEYGNFQNLQVMSIAGNQLSGSLPPGLGNVSSLQELNLHQNQLSGAIPTQLGTLSNLRKLLLDRNLLSGTIPSDIGNLASLTHLFLDNNQLTGQIPVELGNLSNLLEMELEINQLSGTIPQEFGNLSNLTKLRLDRNQLSGSIPMELGSLPNLTYLNLYNNQLSGTVPSELGNLTSLATLHLYYNELTDIGEGLINLQSLTSLKLEFNKFCNLLPTVKTWADTFNPGWFDTQQDCEAPPTPLVDILDTIRGQCSAEVTDVPRALSSIGDTLIGITTDPLLYNTQGTFTITWTYDDGNGNTATQDQIVIVNDTIAPIADVDPLAEVSNEFTVTVSTVPTATDNCVGTINGTTNDPLTYSSLGTHEITWTYNDGNGNVSTQIQEATVLPGYRFASSLEEDTLVGSIGAIIPLEINVHNTGHFHDKFIFSIIGLDPAWYTVQTDTLKLLAGARDQGLASIQVNDCQAIGNHPFQVVITSIDDGEVDTLDALLILYTNPIITDLTPEDNVTMGGTSVLFAWTTDRVSSTSIFIRESGTSNYTEHTNSDGLQHSVLVENLIRNTSYEWYAQSTSECGVATSGVREFSIGNGVVFTQREYQFTIDRDYNQLRTVTVRNDDNIAHDVILSMTKPVGELIVDFTGVGSQDSILTLHPGESRDITLALHAQDATPNKTYELYAYLIADTGAANPIQDYAKVLVTVSMPVIDFTFEEVGFNPITFEKAFKITALSILTDLTVTYEIVSGNGDIMLDPQIEHYRLVSGESIRFKASPDLPSDFTGMRVKITASAAGIEKSISYDIDCDDGDGLIPGDVDDPIIIIDKASYSCPNNPFIRKSFRLPRNFQADKVTKSELIFSRKNWQNFTNGIYRPYNTEFFINGVLVEAHYNTTLENVHIVTIDPEILHPGYNLLVIKTTNTNNGYISLATDISITICLSEYSEWVCAENKEEADEIVRSRSFVSTAGSNLSVNILSPQDGETLNYESPVYITAQVSDDLPEVGLYKVFGFVNNGTHGVTLYDDGGHFDSLAGDGIYGNALSPVISGPINLRVVAKHCALEDSDEINLNLVASPIANDDFEWTNEDSPVNIDVLANDSDADGDPISLVSITQPNHGSTVLNTSDISYTPDVNFNGIDVFEYVITDGNGNYDTAEVHVTVTPINDLPIANNDVATTYEDKAVTIDVLGNDVDVDNDNLIIQSVTQPINGTVNIVDNGYKINFVPGELFDGTDSFTYTISDVHGGAAQATVDVTVLDDIVAPVANVSPLDPVTGSCSAEVTEYPSATDFCVGTVVGTTTDPLVYNDFGTYEITWTYDDGNGNVSTQTQSVIVQDNQPPVPNVDPLPVESGELFVEVTTVPTATDNCFGSITGTTTDPLSYSSLGTHEITWTFDDGNGNVSSQVQEVIVLPGNRFTSSLEEDTLTGSIGATIPLEMNVHNTGHFRGEFTFTIIGLDPAWYTMQTDTLKLLAGGRGQGLALIQVNDCQAVGSYPFQVVVTSIDDGEVDTLDALLVLYSNPIISDLTPEDNVTMGGTSVLFAWSTDRVSSTSLFIRETGTSNYTEHTNSDGLQHSVLVENLTRNTSYEWYAQSSSECGVATSSVREFSVGRGVVFTLREYKFSIDRDYAQHRDVSIRNTDNIAHRVQLFVTNPLGELVSGFIGPGGADSIITLDAGAAFDVTLAVHAQDAKANTQYTLGAYLRTFDEGQPPIQDYSTIKVSVVVPNINFTLEQIDYDPSTLEYTYRIKNHQNSHPLTDLTIDHEVLSGSGAILMDPQIIHNRLGKNDSIDFKVIPILTEDFNGMTAQLIASAAGVEKRDTLAFICQKDMFLGKIEDCSIEARTWNFYCSNRPINQTEVSLPLGLKRKDIIGVQLKVSTSEGGWHAGLSNADFYINGHHVGRYEGVRTNYVFVFDVDPIFLHEVTQGVSKNEIKVVSEHVRTGHQLVLLNYVLSICVSEYSEWLCAENQQEADDLIANRSYILPKTNSITVEILSPLDNSQMPLSDPIFKAQISDEFGVQNIYSAVGILDSNNGSFMLYDDGEHGDDDPQDGIYGNFWTPTYSGPSSFKVIVNNCDLIGIDSTNFTFFDIPEAIDDTVSTLEETSVYIDVVSNDVDRDNDLLSVHSITQPINGGIAELSQTEILYTPQLNFFGVDLFTYVVTDGNGNFDTAEVRVTVTNVNDLPVANNDVVTTYEDKSVTIDVLENDTDIDGNNLKIQSVTQPSNGSVSIFNDSLLVHYTPSELFDGSDNFTYTISDGHGDTAVGTVTVTVLDDILAPVPDNATLSDVTGTCSVEITQIPTATDNCVGEVSGTTTDPLTYNVAGTYTVTWTYDDGNGNAATQEQTVTIQDNTAPVPDVATLATVSGDCSVEVTTVPTATDNCVGAVAGSTSDPLIYSNAGSYSITWTYDDGNGNSSTQTQQVVVNDAAAPVPDVATLPTITEQCSAEVTATPTATDNCVGAVTGTTADPLTYTEPGTHLITWTYTDGNGNQSDQTQTVVVEDVLPVLDPIGDQSGEEEVALDFVVSASDACGDAITLTLTGEVQTGMVFVDSGNGKARFSWEPTNTQAGTYNVTITASDGTWDVLEDITITIDEANQAPVAIASENQTAHPGDVLSLSGHRSTDPDGDYPLTFVWTLIDKPTGSTAELETPDEVSTVIELDYLGEYIVELVVIDAQGEQSAPDLVYISTVNSTPQADAGEDQLVLIIGDQVTLDGSQSEDSDDDPMTFAWSFVSKPEGSSAALNDPTVEAPTFTPDVYGEYVLQLIVSDPWVSSTADEVTITFENVAPVANAGGNVSVAVNEATTLDGSASNDANEDALTYSWTIVTKPTGSNATIVDPDMVQASLVPDVEGHYIIALVVNDGLVDSDPSQVSVVAVSVEDNITENVEASITAINDLPRSAFTRRRQKRNLTFGLNIAQYLIDRGRYRIAYLLINFGILERMNGCNDSGSPDSNDVITDCDAQSEVFPLLQQVVNDLQTLF